MATTSNSASMPHQTVEQTDLLRGLEDQMKNIWHQYVEHLDMNGLDDEAQNLRGRYFDLYRCYRMNREWLGVVSKNS